MKKNNKISKNNKKHLKFNNSYGILWGRNRGDGMKKKRLACLALCAGAIDRYGTRAQKEKYLSPLAKGE